MAVRLGWHSTSSLSPEAVCAVDDAWLRRMSSEQEIDKAVYTPRFVVRVRSLGRSTVVDRDAG